MAERSAQPAGRVDQAPPAAMDAAETVRVNMRPHSGLGWSQETITFITVGTGLLVAAVALFGFAMSEIRSVRFEMQAIRAAATAENESLREDMREDFADLRQEMADLRQEMADLRREMADLRIDMLNEFQALHRRLDELAD